MDLAPAATVLAIAKAAEPYLLKVLGAPLEQVGGLLASPFEEMRRRRSERLAKIAANAAEQMRTVSAEPIQIPDYLAMPLLERATLVDDEDLQQMWASLLANASHPERAADITQAFPGMLAGISPRDAKFLQLFFDAAVRDIFVKIHPIQATVIVNHSRRSEEQLVNVVGNSPFRWEGNEDKAATLQHLVSLGILQRDHEIPLEDLPKLAKYLFEQAGVRPNRAFDISGNLVPHPQDFYSLTIPGAKFVMACRPLERNP